MSIIRNSSAFIPVTNATEIMLHNKTCSHVDNVLYWALNCYAVTISALITNLSLTLIGLFIVILNGVAAHAVLQRDVDDVSDLLIAVLAIADTVVGVFLVYHSVYNLCNWQIFHECMFRYGILLGADLTSVFHLCLLTIDRYMKITWPYLYERIFKKTTVLGLSVSLWIIAMVFGFLPMMGWNYGMPSPTEPQCGFYLILERGYTLLLIFLFLIPFIINAILYGHIFRVAHRHAKSIAEQQTAKSAEKRPSKRTWKFTKTVCLLMGFYFVCWVPTGKQTILSLYFNAKCRF
ncbi:adenosine receptor A2a-like [Liolophura sinensis]|uniref:adenosine receptor A2a-like n=1 Tax=Liolophura sinensis TaxID=3198878 RepID=UPI003158269A